MPATVEIDECAVDCSQLQVASDGDWRQTGQRASTAGNGTSVIARLSAAVCV